VEPLETLPEELRVLFRYRGGIRYRDALRQQSDRHATNLNSW
jgi:hypothetical protein